MCKGIADELRADWKQQGTLHMLTRCIRTLNEHRNGKS
ncbi:unnamed protein product [Rhodiola kirilowii]